VKVVILGSGGSSGTPALDVGWGCCDPQNPRNRRTRPAILVEEGATRILVDTPPDLREQLLAADVRWLSAVVYTHAHADHLHGIDDLRAINRNIAAPLPACGDPATLAVLRERFAYAVEPLPARARSYYKPTLELQPLGDGESFAIGSIAVSAFAQDHGFSTTVGYRFGNAAYSTDVVELPESAFAVIAGIDTWIIGTSVAKPHPTHCHVAKALDWIARIRPRQAILSHLGNDLDYAALAAQLPPGVEPAYDGLSLDVRSEQSAINESLTPAWGGAG
jgi:phosphoribosyl 1,2-cyclic phosphate phosphodiesterase